MLTEQEFKNLYKEYLSTGKASRELLPYKADNAVIMAAGFSSRFAPISNVCPKALLPVKGEILIERQIAQLKEAGISNIYVVVGYKKELYAYLENIPGVQLIENKEYDRRNNNSSLYAVKEFLGNSYICCSDNYFTKNVFTPFVYRPYYSALYTHGATEEYCMTADDSGLITHVSIGGENSWYMLGHVYFDKQFSAKFKQILEAEYDFPETINAYWECLYMKHMDQLSLYINKYDPDVILEFDSLSDLQKFDEFYQNKTAEQIIEQLRHSKSAALERQK